MVAIKALVCVTLVAFSAMACGGGQDVERYFEDIEALDTATDAEEKWTLLNERYARIDPSTMSMSQALQMV